MKKLLFYLFTSSTIILQAQTVVNFNVNDCNSNNHDLFTELNSGKVVVITWVMPCINCAAKAVTAHNAVQSFSASNPGQVKYYIADDYANTSCAALQLWCDTSVALGITAFSNSSVNMSSYGSAGMPKTVVLAGTTTHSVYFNQNGSAANNYTGIQNAITAGMNDILAGIKENSLSNFSTKLLPNPATNELVITYEAKQSETIVVEVYNSIGQKVKTTEVISSIGKNEIKINLESLSNGNYFLKLNNGKSADSVKFLIQK